MKLSLIAVLAIFASCGVVENQVQLSESDAPQPDTVIVAEHATWIYFSEHTFTGSNFRQGMPTPNVKRKLNEAEIKLLDSIIAGYFDPPPDTNPQPKVGCYWPKHAVEIISANSTSSINICFECGSTRSSDNSLGRVPLKAWEVFFQRVGIPVRTGYPEFFGRAKMDSAFRSENGIFQF